MIFYICKRLFWMIPTFLGITFITFFVMQMAPNNEAQMQLLLAGKGVPVESLKQLEKIESQIHIPIAIEGFVRKVALQFDPLVVNLQQTKTYRTFNFIFKSSQDYLAWLKNLCRFDFGYSSKDYRPVGEKIAECLPVTLLLNILSLLFIYAVSLPLGVWMAVHQGERLERWIVLKLFLMFSLPAFWLASLMLVYFAGGDYLNWFPLGGLYSNGFDAMHLWQKICDVGWHLVLPILVMSFASIAFMTRFTQENMMAVLQKAFVRTAEAKGLKKGQVLTRHALRNAILPFVTLFGTLLPGLLGGSVIVEQIFAIPGMGALSFGAVMSRDYNVIMTITAFSAILTLISLLLQDILYAVLDPRIGFTEES